MMGCWPASATDSAVVDTRACLRLLVVELAPPPAPMHPARSAAEPATSTTVARRRRYRWCFTVFLLYCALVVGVLPAPLEAGAADVASCEPDASAIGSPAFVWSMQKA